MLCEVMDMAASSVHETAVSNPPPVRIPTPYGGQLKWTLPGGTVLTAHIKDKDKIRHKKRWSQVRTTRQHDSVKFDLLTVVQSVYP